MIKTILAHAAKTIMAADVHWSELLVANKSLSPEKNSIICARASALKNPVGPFVATALELKETEDFFAHTLAFAARLLTRS